jgi:hypothetical protein
MSVKMRGGREISANLNRELKRIDGDLFKGILLGMKMFQGESQEIAPHDKGVLIGSAFSDADRTRTRVRGRVGYTAEYAPYVHEMPDETNWSKPGTGNKFLFKAVMNNTQRLLDIVRKYAKR